MQQDGGGHRLQGARSDEDETRAVRVPSYVPVVFDFSKAVGRSVDQRDSRHKTDTYLLVLVLRIEKYLHVGSFGALRVIFRVYSKI